MISDSRDKLNQSRYFLEQMKEHLSDGDAFKYSLDAFLSAARSVTYIMQKEFAKVKGFSSWYLDKQNRMKQDEMMTFFNEKRVVSIHTKPVSPSDGGAFVNVVQSVPIPGYTVSAKVIDANGTVVSESSKVGSKPTYPKPAQVTTGRLWYFHDLPDKEVIDACEEHIVKLDCLVAECEECFSPCEEVAPGSDNVESL